MNKYISEKVKLKRTFLEYLKIEHFFEDNLVMIMKPLPKQGYLNLHHIKTMTSQALSLNIKVSELCDTVQNHLQETRYKINRLMFTYLTKYSNYFLTIEKDKQSAL